MAIYRWRKSTVAYGENSDYISSITKTTPDGYFHQSTSRPTVLSDGTYILNLSHLATDHQTFPGVYYYAIDRESTWYVTKGSDVIGIDTSGTSVTFRDPSGGVLLRFQVSSGPGTFVEYVYSTSSTAYPNGGVSGDYYYDQRTSVSLPPDSINVQAIAMQGNPISVSWPAVDGAESYTLQRKANTDSDWVQVYSGSNTSFEETVGTWTSVQYQVCTVAGGISSSYTASSTVSIIPASALVISGSDGDLGTITSDVAYTVLSDGTSALTVTETVNGLSRTYTATNGAENTISVLDLPTGYGTIDITASTNPGAGVVSVERHWTYTKTAPTFSNAGSVADLLQQGQTIWAKTIAEAVRTPGIWGGNLGLALSKLAHSVQYFSDPIPKYVQVNINFATATVGQEVNLPYNGVMSPHIVVQIGNPNSALYDASCDGVWLLRKDIVGNGQWNSSGTNTLPNSTIMQTMAGYVANYASEVQAAIKTVKIPYCVGAGSYDINSGANGLECKMFPLSAKEVGIQPMRQPEDGALLSYFILGVSLDAQERRKATFNGTASVWSTRSMPGQYNDMVFGVNGGGQDLQDYATVSRGYRPCFILPSTFTATYFVAGDGTVHDAQEYEEAGTFTDISGGTIPMVSIETGSYVGTGTYGKANPNSLTFGFAPDLVIVRREQAGSMGIIYVRGMINLSTDWSDDTTVPACTCSLSGNSFSWYSVNNAAYQLNIGGKDYHYIAIGQTGGAS